MEPLTHVVTESALGYGAVVVGIARAIDGSTVSPFVAGLLRSSTVPVIVVRPGHSGGRLPAAFARAVVPVSGTAASRAAQELAFGLGERLGTEVVLAHIVTGDDGAGHDDRTRRESTVGHRLVVQAAELGAATGARTIERVGTGSSTAEELLQTVEESGADLVVIGANRRDLGDGSPYLGHNVERLLLECAATVAVVAMPPDT